MYYKNSVTPPTSSCVKIFKSFLILLIAPLFISQFAYSANNALKDNEIDALNEKNSTSPSVNSVQRDFPPMFAFQRQLAYGGNPYGPGSFGGGYGGGMNGAPNDNVNFDFQCKCTARSNLEKNMQTPTDANQAAQQQIQQLQDQIRRLQQQIQRSTSGKSSFEQFAQMLAQADGLECNCSGASTSAGSFPSNTRRGTLGNGVLGGPMGLSPYGNNGGGGGIGPYGIAPYGGGHNGPFGGNNAPFGGNSGAFGQMSNGFNQYYPSPAASAFGPYGPMRSPPGSAGPIVKSA